jgi:DEAD/DEAH box helicase domain-containing protein
VIKLDLVSRVAEAVPFVGNYYTVPAGTKETRILHVHEESDFGRTHLHFGDINVNEVISMYKKLQFHNHQNLGYVELTRPLQKDYDTESTWMEIPPNVVNAYRKLLMPSSTGELILNNHFEGIAYAIKNAAMMVTMTERDDIDAILSNNALIPDGQMDQVVSLYIYDKYVGGLGYSEKIYDLIPQIVDHAIQMVKGCSCEDGCPACVGDYNLDKHVVLWGLENLKEMSDVPASFGAKTGTSIEPPRPAIQKEFSFFELPDRWGEFCERVIQNGESGGSFLKTIQQAEVAGHKLILTLEHAFYESWLMDPDNRKSIENTLRYHAVCPGDMQLEVRLSEDLEKRKKMEQKLKRHYENKQFR